jgi:arsenate reductase (thioredoxin)
LLQQMRLPTEGLRSKSWDEFSAPGAPVVDDPAAVEGSETDKWLAFRRAFHELESRVKAFTSLPLQTLDRIKLKERLDAIGQTRTTDSP